LCISDARILDMNMNTKVNIILVVFNLFQLLKLSSCTSIIRKDGYCVVYGDKTGLPTEYNGPAKPLATDNYEILKEVCPNLTQLSSTTSCCNIKQVERLQSTIKTLSTFTSRCPACYQNLKDMFCEVTCSSNQSRFLKYQNDASEYHVTNEYANGLFNSCKDVTFPQSQNKFLEVFCGTSYHLCTPQKFLNFLGSKQNGSPLNIVYMIDKTATNITSNDFPMIKCNETFSKGSMNYSACGCHDCRTSVCLPTTPPPPETPSNAFVITINSSITYPVDSYQIYQGKTVNFTGVSSKFILNKILKLHDLIHFSVIGTWKNKAVSFKDVCMISSSTNNTECKIESPLQYFQMKQENLDKCVTNMNENCDDPTTIGTNAEDWHDQLMGCIRNPFSMSNGHYLKLPCISTYGAPIRPYKVFGNYDEGNYLSSKSFVLTYFLNEELIEKNKRTAWEKSFVTFLNMWKTEKAPKLNLSMSFVHRIPMYTLDNATRITTTTSATTKSSGFKILVKPLLLLFVLLISIILH